MRTCDFYVSGFHSDRQMNLRSDRVCRCLGFREPKKICSRRSSRATVAKGNVIELVLNDANVVGKTPTIDFDADTRLYE